MGKPALMLAHKLVENHFPGSSSLPGPIDAAAPVHPVPTKPPVLPTHFPVASESFCFPHSFYSFFRHDPG